MGGVYPIKINNTFYSMIEKLPPQDIEKDDFTLKYWGYASFSTDNLSYYSKEGEVKKIIFSK